MKKPLKKTLLAGLGNPLSGDDGFGPRVIERLRECGLPSGVMLLDAGTDLLNHVESFAEYERVVLIDAILDPERKLGAPGRVAVVNEKTFSTWPETSQGVHQMSPLLGVKLFRTLHPEAKTEICFLGLFLDQVSRSPLYMTPARLDEAVLAAVSLVSN